MNVNLIYYTGAESQDPWYAARLLVYTKNTRLTQGEDTRYNIFVRMTPDEISHELDYISKTIRSSWEFVDYVFEIQGVTRAFTHQLVRTRTASYAQQAQRVVNMSEFEALKPDTVKGAGTEEVWDKAVDQIKDSYAYLHAQGIPAQDCRGLLPTNVLTNIIMKVNLRTLADLSGKRDNPRAQGEYVDVIRAMKKEVLAVHPWAKSFLEPERTATPHLDKIMSDLAQGEVFNKPELNAALKEIDALKGTWG